MSALSDKEVFKLIFTTGFSTGAQVTAISGRGVGMDVVRRGIEALGGHIDIDYALGRGTTFRIVLLLSDADAQPQQARTGRRGRGGFRNRRVRANLAGQVSWSS